MKSLSTSHKTALLVFTRTHNDEILHKRFLPSRNRKLELQTAKVLVQQTLNTACESGYPVYIEDSRTQKGRNFAEKLQLAISNTFSKGYDNIICIGSDSPDLNKTHIQEAANELSKGKPTLGASTDGGIYLLGLTRNSFDEINFGKIGWQGPKVFSSLLNCLSEVNVLEDILDDIDSCKDLLAFLANKPSDDNRQVSLLLANILQIEGNTPKEMCPPSRISCVLLPSTGLRAPPIYS